VTDAQVIGRLLDEYHERSVPPTNIEVLAGSVHEARISYKLTVPDGPAQLVRAYRADGAVPMRGRGPFTETVPDWLLGRAETLDMLAAAGYAAPRPVLTRTGELIAVAGPWLAWATTYIPGVVLDPTLDQLQALGETLARLHRVVAGGRDRQLSPRHPAIAVALTLARLDAVAAAMPGEWQWMAAAFRRTMVAVEEAASQHYAFLVGEEEFDAAFGRICDQALPYWADPAQTQPQVINYRDGGRGVYFEDPDGHRLEIITRPYGSGS
jgi:catechol 2,3-dioxygenase-like lactoylglutathione lyase family enzyme